MGISKWIGGVLGAIWGGPIGSLVGFGVGAAIDAATSHADSADGGTTPPPRVHTGYRPHADYGSTASQSGAGHSESEADEFTICVCVLIAGVMKSDGALLPEEAALVAHRLKENYHFDDAGVRRMISFIHELAQGDWSVEEFAQRAKRHLSLPARRNLLFFLLEIAYADGQYVFAEQAVIHTVAGIFGVRASEVTAMEASLSRVSTDWAYQVLELSRSATDGEVKKAYRRLALIHHPDKVAGQGDVAVAAATRKFQAIRDAYDEIKKERNFN